MKQPARSEGGFRLFSEMEIRDLVFIQKAQELGFSLTEIKQLSVLHQQMQLMLPLRDQKSAGSLFRHESSDRHRPLIGTLQPAD